MDWGDAPDNSLNSADYPTLSGSGGAAAWYDPTFCLGSYVDYESDGWRSDNADGDDTHARRHQHHRKPDVVGFGQPETTTRVTVEGDDQGVAIPNTRRRSAPRVQNLLQIRVTDQNSWNFPSGRSAFVNAWIDFDGAMEWESGEQVIQDNVLQAAYSPSGKNQNISLNANGTTSVRSWCRGARRHGTLSCGCG